MDFFTKPRIPNPVTDLDLGGLLATIINAALVFGGAFAVLFIIIGGFRFIFSMGNQEGVERARQTVLYAILGVLLVFLSYLIVQFLLNDFLRVEPAYRLS